MGTLRPSRPSPTGPSRSLRHDVPLVGDVDLEAAVASVPDGYAVKGMFFTRYVEAMGPEWETAAKTLVAPPPPKGRYHAFEDYPMTDYLRVFGRVARARFPGATREAFRLLARAEIDVFADSTIGKVTFAMLRSPEAALLRFPDIFAMVTKGPVARAAREGAREVSVTVERAAGSIEQVMGMLEGLVLAFDENPTLEPEREEPRTFAFTVRW